MSASHKVLLMGRSGSGKSSMRSLIFANYLPNETKKLAATFNVEHSQIRFLNGMLFSIWDCGGQSLFYDNYFGSERENTFSNVKTLIYTFDVKHLSGDEQATDLEFFNKTIEALLEYSSGCQIFVIITKIDLIPTYQREEIFKTTSKLVNDIVIKSFPSLADNKKIDYFFTSIWDNTIYKAWGTIVCSLIPNLPDLQKKLDSLCEICESDEVFLYERSTFLLIASSTCNKYSNKNTKHRNELAKNTEKYDLLSNVLKGLVMLCNESRYSFESMNLVRGYYNLYIDLLSPNTYIVVSLSNSDVHLGAVKINIELSKDMFKDL